MNNKLYLFSKFLYYVFAKNYVKNNINFQILINLAINLKQLYPDLYNSKKKKNKDKNKKGKNFDNNKAFFLEDFDCLCLRTDKTEKFSSFIKDLYFGLNEYKISSSNYFYNIIYDNYSKRSIIICSHVFIITEKNDISNFYIKSERIYFANLIYLSFLGKNMLVFLEKNDLNFYDLKDTKILYRLPLYKDFIKNYNEMKSIELIENEYLILNIKKSLLAKNVSEDFNILIYKIIPGDNNNLLQYEYLNKIPHNNKNINRYKDMIVFQNEEKLIFSKINKNENNFEEVFSLIHNSEHDIEITDINNNKILIKYLRGARGGNQYLNKFEIYDIEKNQKLSEIKCEKPFNDIFFFGEKYLLQIRDHYFYILELNSLNKISE